MELNYTVVELINGEPSNVRTYLCTYEKLIDTLRSRVQPKAAPESTISMNIENNTVSFYSTTPGGWYYRARTCLIGRYSWFESPDTNLASLEGSIRDLSERLGDLGITRSQSARAAAQSVPVNAQAMAALSCISDGVLQYNRNSMKHIERDLTL